MPKSSARGLMLRVQASAGATPLPVTGTSTTGVSGSSLTTLRVALSAPRPDGV